MKPEVLAKAQKIAQKICSERRSKTLPAVHVAFIVKKNRIISIGFNKDKTNPNSIKYNYIGASGDKIVVNTHAELDAILKYKKSDISNCELIVLRYDGDGKLNNSKPCHGCSNLLKEKRIKKVYFSTSDGRIVKGQL